MEKQEVRLKQATLLLRVSFLGLNLRNASPPREVATKVMQEAC